ncbi:MAG: UvrD-helicase domain-containing protein, partial [Treponema sp.]|nr:UvrD-helicase domain-containing protein [Treponema sp.]
MEPKKNRPELNDEQRAAAFCTENAVVAAGAGSGKTLVLASRFAWLITEKNIRIHEILSLTFTRKAAAQMYQRIHALLSEIAAEDSGVKGERARQALNDFIHARIQTLDSYSAALVTQAAVRYGISPNFTIDEGRCRELALEESLPFVIARRAHPALERLYSQKSPEMIAHDIFAEALFNYSAIDEPPGIMRDIQKQFEIICAEWKQQYITINDLLNKMAESISADETLLPDLVPLTSQFISGRIVFPGEAEIRDYFIFIKNTTPESCIEKAESHPVQDAIIKTLTFMSEINSLNLRKGKKSDNHAKEAIKQLRGIFAAFSSLAVFCLQAALIQSVMFLLDDLQRRYLNKKRSEGVLTFNDVARLARTILLEQQDLRQSEKESFKAIMIDEFQDNNELQKELLFLLAEKPELTNKGVPPAADLSPGKLFFVGDEKQSIYRFRGADVSVFRKLKNELHSRELPLKTNYRSAPLLIGSFNTIFGGSKFDCMRRVHTPSLRDETEGMYPETNTLPKQPYPVRSAAGLVDPEGKETLPENPSVFAASSSLPLHEAAYSPLLAGKEGEGKLSLCILDKKNIDNEESESLAAVENEARFTAERIQYLLNEKNEAGGPKYRPDDIAILFRSRGPQYLFEKHLRLLNIPYACEDLNGFFFGGPVNDIMSVLRLAAYPLDRAAYAEMLRSPFTGLSLPGLAICLAAVNKPESPRPFDDEPLPLLADGDHIKYRQGQRLYHLIRDKSCTESISSLVSELWYNQGYRYETEWNPQTAIYHELYDYLFHLAAQADTENKDLAAFTDSVQALRDSGERLRDIEIPLERPSAVHLLTVHKSKGLEFPVVFLCCCDKHSQWSSASAVFDTSEAGITLNPPLPAQCAEIDGVKRNYFWERALNDEKSKRLAELRRLLYVGMTRAENELYLTGVLGIGKDNKDEKNDFSLRLKKYYEEKIEKNSDKNTIDGDTILDNDTFFGLCLPALTAHIPPEGLKAKYSFFNIEEIPAYSQEYIRECEVRGATLSNDQKGLNIFFERAEPFYRDAQFIQTPLIKNRHIAPSSLQKMIKPSPEEDTMTNGYPDHFIISKEYSGDNASDVFGKVDTMLDRYNEQDEDSGERFNSGGFGTIAHICAEALLNGEEAIIPPKLSGFLSAEEAGAFLAAGNELAARFVRSPLGKIAQSAQMRKNEFQFRSFIPDSQGNDHFISGTIDLLFEEASTIHIVDFKTDNRENPNLHIAQMACYYRAVYDLFVANTHKECRLWLYYLRSGHAIEMTEKAKNYNL